MRFFPAKTRTYGPDPVTFFRPRLDVILIRCWPARLSERTNQFLETSFLPSRSFTSVADFNEQLVRWLPTANSPTVRSLQARPIDRVAEDRAAMLAVPPPPVGFTTRIRLPRDYYVRVFGNDYSDDPSAIGRMVDVHANLTQVTVRLNGQVIAAHERAMGSAATITDPEHVSAAKRCGSASKPRHRRNLPSHCSGTWPIKTRRSASTSTGARRSPDERRHDQADRVPLPRPESTPHPRRRFPSRRASGRRGLVPRGLPRRGP
jgi:hypothetical protein